ncbi:MAG TPA: vanadium-dependent haloperoxidase [Gemmataceae bacterium]|nr:vanadium-dependent haloperoxidase [Gemmataceae bacterium]
MFTQLWHRAGARGQRAPRNRMRANRTLRLGVEALEERCLMSADVVIEWNQLFLNTARANRVSPVLITRDAAIVSAAVYDAVNDIDRSYTPYFADVKASQGASLEAASAQAAHDTLSALFPAQQATFDATLAADLANIPPGRARQGVAVGQAVAQAILTWRSTDGSNAHVNYTPGTAPGDWQPTPPAFLPAALPQWGNVTPFGIPSGSAFRAAPPPALTSADYTTAFNEVKTIGDINSTTRTADQSQIAQFWYGQAGTYTASGYWNQIAEEVAVQQGNSLVQNARLFALLNLTEADAAIAVWDTKYTYNFWRPVTAIRAADTDGNPDTTADPSWTPFLVTPNHPSYCSGHSGVSSGAATVLAAFFGTDAISFSLSSDSLPGTTRSYTSFSAAAQEASDSRVYAGIHWRFDVVAGARMGNQVGTYITTHFLLPVSGSDDGGSDSAFRAGPSHSGRSMVVSPPLAALFRTAVQPGMMGGTASSTGLGVQAPLPASIKDVSPLQLVPSSAWTLSGKLAGPPLHHVLAHIDLGRLPAALVDELALARLG